MGQTENGYLVGSGGAARRWWAYGTSEFPLDRLEPECVVDSNGTRSERLVFGDGSVRTWQFRPLEPIPAKQRDLKEFYDSLAASIVANGVLVPVLIWQAPDGRYFTRYGASRVHVQRRLGRVTIPAIVCSYRFGHGEGEWWSLNSPADVLAEFGPLASLGWLEVSFERIDAHHLEPLI